MTPRAWLVGVHIVALALAGCGSSGGNSSGGGAPPSIKSTDLLAPKPVVRSGGSPSEQSMENGEAAQSAGDVLEPEPVERDGNSTEEEGAGSELNAVDLLEPEPIERDGNPEGTSSDNAQDQGDPVASIDEIPCELMMGKEVCVA